jgi:ferredoxin-NADP reductase
MAINIDPHQFPALERRIAEREGRSPVMDRAFSLCSTPLDPGFVEITVKEEKGSPLLTPYLARKLQVGDPLTFSGPFGLYVLPEPLDPALTGILHVVAGSGVAPNRGILRHCLRAGLPLRHLLIVQNRRPEDILYRRELDDTARAADGRVRVVNVISRPAASAERWTGPTGRATRELIRRQAEGFLDLHSCLAFVCGPNQPRGSEPGFIDRHAGVRRTNQPGTLGELGISFERIVVESW